MLVAITKNEKVISLANQNLQKENLHQLRQEDQFFCPACKGEVILKLGTKQAWHFAHKAKLSCTDEVEGETPYHIEGKKLLYEWLLKQNYEVLLEQYLPDVKQRPDLLVRTPNQTFAIEFQCAKISPQLFEKRTLAYQNHHYTPIWIIGGNQLKRRYQNVYHLCGFHWLFAKCFTLKNRPEILSFCPLNNTFIHLKNINAISSNLSAATPSFLSLYDLTLEMLSQPYIPLLQIDAWLNAKNLWRTQRLHMSKPQQFLRDLYYKKGEPFWLFPSCAGIPVCFHHFIETPTYIWQAWILEMFINNKKKGEKFHLNLVKRAFKSLVKKGTFQLRTLPLLFNGSDMSAIENYLGYLCHIKVLSTRDRASFVIVKEIQPLKTLEQAMMMDRQFLLKFVELKT